MNRKESDKRYYEENKEKIRIKSKLYYLKNKEKWAEYRKEWKSANPEKMEEIRIARIINGVNSKASKIYKNKNKEKVKEINKKYQESNKEILKIKAKERLKVYTHSNKHKLYASAMIRRMVKKGKLIKPDKCSICANSSKIEGHHEDYSKPKEVVWVCRTCHANIHSRLRRP